MVQLGSYMTNEHAKIVKVDREGNITESFSYGDEDSYYYITDMIAEGNINTPEKLKRVLELGAFCAVVGSAITRPQLITKSFANAIK